MSAEKKVLQIIPGTGWAFEDRVKSRLEGTGYWYGHERLTCIALVEVTYDGEDTDDGDPEVQNEVMGMIVPFIDPFVDLTDCVPIDGLECGGQCENTHFQYIKTPDPKPVAAPDA